MNNITISGNVTRDPVLRFTTDQTPVTNFGIASTPRYQDDNGEWTDGDTVFLDVAVFGSQAENVAKSLSTGNTVLVTGKVKATSFTPKDSDTEVTRLAINADDVAASLRYHTITINPRD